RRVMAREAHAREYVDLEVALPLGVRDVEKRLARVDPEVVDEDVGLGNAREYGLRARGAGAIGGDALGLGAGQAVVQPRQRGVDGSLRAACDRDLRAFGGESARDRKADAGGR